MKFITHESEVSLNKGFVAVYFYTDQFLFHQKYQIMINKVEHEFKEIIFYAIDLDSFKNAISRYNLTALPTLLIFNNGKMVKKISNLISTQNFIDIFRDIYNLYGDNNGKEK